LDDDGDGIQDDGERGIGGLIVKLVDADGNPVAQTTTDASGNYNFPNLPAGTYTVVVEVPNTYVPSPADKGDDAKDSDLASTKTDGGTLTITLRPVQLGAGQNNPTLDLGLTLPDGSIGNLVWVDLDKDGVQDAGEPGQEGILVILRDEDGKEIDRTTTDAGGTYIFTDLPAGNYSIDFLIPDGTDVSPAGAGSDPNADSDGQVTDTVTIDGKTYTVLSTGPIALQAGQARADIDQGILANAQTVDLALEKTVVTKTTGDDHSATWTLTVTNNGPGTANGPITITDKLPATLKYVSFSSDDDIVCDYASNTVTCTLADDMAEGDAVTVDVITQIMGPNGTVVTNDAAVASENSETTTSNNIDSQSVTAGEDLPVDLSLEKSAKASKNAGEAIWTLAVKNVGADDKGTVTITDSLPSTLTYVDFEGDGWDCSREGKKVLCVLSSGLAAGASSSVDIVTKIDAPAGTVITNTATVSSTSSERDLDNNTDEAEIQTATKAQPIGQSPVAFTGANSLRLAAIATLLGVAGLALVALRRRTGLR